jgi:hypothetical protein
VDGCTRVAVVFDDASSSWYNVWVAQPQNGTAYAVSRTADNRTRGRLGKASITLPAVPLNNGESRAARGSFGLANGAPLLTLAVQTSLKNASNGGQLAPVNGGSCQAKGGPIVQ